MKLTLAILVVAGLFTGCNPGGQNQPANLNEPAGAQGSAVSTSEPPKTTKEISSEHGWTGTNEAGRSTNSGISPGGANSRGVKNP